MKKILLLGGSRYILPIIKSIHGLGHYAITCDYLPDNIAHQHSDEYHNVSIIDKEKVLLLAHKLHIDGIMSFACDPGVETAAYVAEKLNLPSVGSFESVSILQNKSKFRQFLSENGFNVPRAKGYRDYKEALRDIEWYNWPVIVKPVDSAGSKGVTRVDELAKLKDAVEYALKFSRTNKFIIEEFIEKRGHSSDSDCFSVDGNLVFASFNDQMFDLQAANPYTPSAFSWPSTMPNDVQLELRAELQRLMDLLRLKTSIYNIETRYGVDGKPYIMEVSPRGGGNRLAELLRYASGVDLLTNAVRAAVGDSIIDVDNDPIYNGSWAEVILHADAEGKFDSLWIDPEAENKYVVEKDLWIEPGSLVRGFTGANEAIGTLVLRFENQTQLEQYMRDPRRFVRIIMK